MCPSRGVHIVLPLDLPAGGDALLIPKTEDGRVLFAIPWMGRLLVGTTDEPVDQPEASAVSRDEIEYLLRHLNRYLAKPVAPEEIVSAFAGVRPLVSSGGAAGRATKELARDHVLEVEAASGLISILGGKWTTYRTMAEDTIDAVERQLHRPRTPCRTANYQLIGSDAFRPDSWRALVSQFSISESSARHLAEKFGSRAPQVLALAGEDPALAEPLIACQPSNDGPSKCHSEPRIASEASPAQTEISPCAGNVCAAIGAGVVFCARYEMAVTIEDILARRLGLESYGWREALAAASAVADLLAAELHWPAEQKRRALADYTSRLRRIIGACNLPV
jgi:glycerol-3-phosphate dehydrogenase